MKYLENNGPTPDNACRPDKLVWADGHHQPLSWSPCRSLAHGPHRHAPRLQGLSTFAVHHDPRVKLVGPVAIDPIGNISDMLR